MENTIIKKCNSRIIEILNDEDIENFVKERKLIYQNLKMTEIDENNEISTDKCKVLCCAIGLNYISSQYGDMLGAFKYIDGRIFTFRFHVHEPYQRLASLSNKMTKLEKIVKNYYKDFCFYEEALIANFGYEAFQTYLPYESLDDENKALRDLMKSLTKYSRSKNYCKELRKSDKKRIKYLKQLNSSM